MPSQILISSPQIQQPPIPLPLSLSPVRTRRATGELAGLAGSHLRARPAASTAVRASYSPSGRAKEHQRARPLFSGERTRPLFSRGFSAATRKTPFSPPPRPSPRPALLHRTSTSRIVQIGTPEIETAQPQVTATHLLLLLVLPAFARPQHAVRADTTGQAVQPVPCGRVHAQPVSVWQAIAAVQEDTVPYQKSFFYVFLILYS